MKYLINAKPRLHNEFARVMVRHRLALKRARGTTRAPSFRRTQIPTEASDVFVVVEYQDSLVTKMFRQDTDRVRT